MGFWARTHPLDDEACMVSFGGDLDLYTAASCRQALSDAIATGARQVLVDLSGTTAIDSTAIGVLIVAENALQRRGGSLVLFCDNRRDLPRFERAGLTRLFEVRSEHRPPTTDATVAEHLRFAREGRV